MDKERRAENARRLLHDDTLREAFDSIRQREEATLLNIDPDDFEGFKKARLQLWAIEQVERRLKGFVADYEIQLKKERSAP